jgi:murein DD-endopeptidase MepM/ murein hydrolase activator NlpD
MTAPLRHFSRPNEYGKFGAVRKYDVHTGIDLYCKNYASVYAIEDGEVVRIEPFTGKDTDSNWWNDTQCVVVRGRSGYILYGEVKPAVWVGDKIKEGQILGNVLTVLKKDKGLPMTMLHLELYAQNMSPVVWKIGEPQPDGLLDPSNLIVHWD